MDCPNYTDFKNGRVSLSGVSVGDTATFTCNDGYELVGDSSLICLSDGTWDSSPPVCQGPTGNMAHHLLLKIVFFFGITVIFHPSTYTVTEGVDEFVELIMKAENIKRFVAINVSFTPQSAQGKIFHCKMLIVVIVIIKSIAGSDFVATPKVEALAPGQTEDTIKVIIIDDSTEEETEIFTAILSTGDMETPATATVTILDNDGE